MNRRDFLFLRTTPRGRVLELSCRALYMRTVDAPAPTAQSAVLDHEPWMGEPPTDFAKPAADDWQRQLEVQLHDVDVVKLLDEAWLDPTGLGEELEPILAAFRARGGRVERRDR